MAARPPDVSAVPRKVSTGASTEEEQ